MVRVLALHGKSQNKEVFRTRLSALPKKLKKFGVSFHIVEAPHDMPLREGDSVAMKTWFDRIEFRSVEPESLETTLKLVEREWKQAEEEGDPFKAILGFSQGGTLTGIISSQPDRFPGLKFVVVVGAPNNDIVDATTIPRGLMSLHCAGETDAVVPIDSSRALADKFHEPEFYVHEQGHCIPSRAVGQRKIVLYFETMVNMLKEEAALSKEPASVAAPAPAPVPAAKDTKVKNEAALEGQRDEIEALMGIYEDLVELHSVPAAVGDETLSFSVRLSSPDLPSVLEKQVGVRFSMSSQYPEEGTEQPHISVEVGSALSLKDFPTRMKTTLLQTLCSTAAEHTAMQSQCAFACIQAAIDWLCDPTSPSSQEETQQQQVEGGAVESDESEKGPAAWYQRGSDPSEMTEEEEEAEVGMMELATKHAAAAQARRLNRRGAVGEGSLEEGEEGDDEESEGSSSKGVWRYCIGFVGKPSAGKSTLYNCATRAALNRAGRLEAAVGAQPFTTIDPNISDGFFLGPAEEATTGSGEGSATPVEFSYGVDEATGRRLLPVKIKDVAGLVPGAYKGRGKGNKFLNDLTDADCLVHVVDSSGLSDESGNLHHTADQDKEGEGSERADTDARWIRQELHRWIFHNVKAKWDTVVRRSSAAPMRGASTGGTVASASGAAGHKRAIARVVALFTGYKSSPATVRASLKDAGLDSERAAKYSEQDVHTLVAHFLQRRFPICLALNKVDLVPQAKLLSHIRECQASARLRGELAVPVCAAAEYQAIKKLAAEQQLRDEGGKSGEDKDEETDEDRARVQRMTETVEALGGCSSDVGVLACISSAVSMRAPVYLYPVSDLGTLAPIAWSGGSAPPPRLQDCLLAKPGSSVGDIFSALKVGASPRARLNGEFVRCSAMPHAGGKVTQLGKDSVLTSQNCILHIQANRKSVWQ